MTTDMTYPTRYTESDEELDETINFKAIEYNDRLIRGIEAFERRDYQTALEKYLQALDHIDENDFGRRALLKSNIAMIYFYNHDYKKALEQLELTLREFRDQKYQSPVLNDYEQALLIKLLGNLCALSLFLNKFGEAMDYSNEIISIISLAKPNKKRVLHEGLCYIFFRFKNFESLKDGYFQNLEDKYSGETLGCLYLILGVNRELLDDPQLAFIYYKKSFEVWAKLDDKLFMLLLCRHITAVAQILKYEPELNEYNEIMRNLVGKDELRNVSIELLFKDFEKRMSLAKDITMAIRKQEDNIDTVAVRESTRNAIKIDEPNLLGEPLWKQALRLKLSSALKSIEALRHDFKTKPSEKKQLDTALGQIKKSLQMLQEERNPLIEEQLINLKYTREAIDTLKATVNRVRKVLLANCYLDAFRKLMTNKEQKSRVSMMIKSRNLPTSIYSRSQRAVTGGDLLTKINYHNGNKSLRYFKLCDDNTLRWAQKEKDLNNPKVYRVCPLADIRGIIYGKTNPKFVKNAKGLEPWLCFSLVLENRTIDLYCREDQINYWVIGLSEELKRIRPKAVTLTVGKYFWRKLAMMGTFKIGQYILGDRAKKERFRTFAKALTAFKSTIQK